MTHEEYKANISGLNIFFGAIIGVVMADIETSSTLEYSLILVMLASFIVMLLYISASKHRLFYAAFSAGVLLFAWFEVYLGNGFQNIDLTWLQHKLLPTLSVWFAMIISIEFVPRSAPNDSNDR